MDNDDQQLGRILSRREILALFGAGGITLLAACGPQQTGSGGIAPASTTVGAIAQAPTTAVAAAATQVATPMVNAEAQTTVAQAAAPSAQAAATAEVATVDVANTSTVPNCVVRPEVTEGPYYVDEDLVRTDIRSDPTTNEVKAGTPLVLTFNVSQVSGSSCSALAGATIDIWHCDAAGTYSDVSDPGFNTKGQKWLRGSQVTDATGKATFTTIYPGWYSGRAVHIHFKVHPNETAVFTSQLFFDETLSDQVFTQAPYASKGKRDTLNSTDSIYQELLLLTTTKTDQGYTATFPIGVDLSTLGTGSSNGGGGPGGSPPTK